MKRMIPFFFCFIVATIGTTIASAAEKGGFVAVSNATTGFSGPGPTVSSVKDATSMRDDALVVLRGNIVQHLGKDKYLFKDGSGTLSVEIDDDKWQGQTVTSGDMVELHGEIDKDWNSVEVEVDRIAKLP